MNKKYLQQFYNLSTPIFTYVDHRVHVLIQEYLNIKR